MTAPVGRLQPLVALRRAFGLLALARWALFLAEGHGSAWLGESLHLPLVGFAPAGVWPIAHALGLLLIPAGAAGILHGRHRISAFAVAAGFWLVAASDLVAYQNAFISFALLALGLAVAPAAWDARRGADRPASGRELWILRGGVSLMYLAAGLWKFNADFLNGKAAIALIRVNWASVHPAIGPALDGMAELPLLPLLGWGTAIFELWLALGMWHPKTRTATALAGLAMHAGFAVIGFRDPNLILWSLLIAASYLSFFAPLRARWPQGRERQWAMAAAVVLLLTCLHAARALLGLGSTVGHRHFATFNMWDRGYTGARTSISVFEASGRPRVEGGDPAPWVWQPGFLARPYLSDPDVLADFGGYLACLNVFREAAPGGQLVVRQELWVEGRERADTAQTFSLLPPDEACP